MITSTNYQVTLESAEHDAETFEYESLGEAMAGHERLIKSATKYGEKDHVKRDVTLQIVTTVRPQHSASFPTYVQYVGRINRGTA